MNENKDMKKQLGRMGTAVLSFDLMMMAVTIIGTFGLQLMAAKEWKSGAEGSEAIAMVLAESSQVGGYLLGLLLGFVIIYMFRKKLLFSHDLKVSNRKITWSVIAIAIITMLGIQMVYSLLAEGSESIFNIFGYTLQDEIASASGEKESTLMFIYSVFLGPIMEEVVFRGAVLRSLEKYGKIFAIVTSAILFGLYHGNLLQGLFAFTVGVAFAYIALEYSIKWSMALHIFNNGLSEVIDFCEESFGEHIVDVATNYIFGIALGLTVIIMFLKRKKIVAYIKNNPTEKGAIIGTCTRVSVIIFTILGVAMSIIGIQKM